ncbi:hypothetical protein DICPUDRAFT_83730 [Dictyostelium purpureum]|uniref:TRAF-type domain-containing protein n=1 Tax=Dictyostelium purpureum TaxID=5786 RepID=F1A0F7_DICPU|nr:uncharacterized protein DICPUDRAFT_83730 [Dictyostelium purpureum]EGC30330.1 hypothetical protein DICPUDRAFT_83730 [Dictyostelium purpureum]|eukprot:XP_003293153.1 hypothetical protein DICPUDRAFT_83730 [Dictyostelium purpureum]
MENIKIKYDIIDLVCDEKELFSNIYSCPVCYEPLFKKQIYQCSEGHWACRECFQKIINSNNSHCMSCRKKIGSFNELSRNRGLELMIQSKKIHCPYSFSNIWCNPDEADFEKQNNVELFFDLDNGCKETFKVEQLNNHLEKCNYRFVECSNFGCDEIVRLNKIEKHQEICKFARITCRDCETKIKRIEETDHTEVCPSVLIVCVQCNQSVKRCYLKDHIENTCEQGIIKCKYGDCQSVYKRNQLSNHLKQVDHSESMKRIIDLQEEEIEQYKEQLKESNERCLDLIKNFKVIDRIFTNYEESYRNKWEISDFKQKIRNFGVFDSILSLSFKIGFHKFYLGISLTGKDGFNNKDTDHFTLYLYNKNNIPTKVRCEFEVINHIDKLKNKKIEFSGVFEKTYEEQDNYIEYVVSKLSDLSRRNGFLSNDSFETLSINFSITVNKNNTIFPLKN